MLAVARKGSFPVSAWEDDPKTPPHLTSGPNGASRIHEKHLQGKSQKGGRRPGKEAEEETEETNPVTIVITGVNRDAKLEPGETILRRVSPASCPVTQITSLPPIIPMLTEL